MQLPKTVAEMAIWVVVCAAVIALMFIALHEFGIVIPAWVVQCFWIVVVAVGVIFAIKLVIGAKD